ncbi:hypothetical protein ACFQ09_11335 [Massilia norwichensis]|uniref:DUF4148 domain-containing protein n=1 Tax=Massilia norwichensis TaxID=1442366 RepID=A0ABT2AB03_9BURK|nr:hypothetical protein [Massilia norwichensis]MCS0591368.1 hypothetical protein [Massilia norwichensis]
MKKTLILLALAGTVGLANAQSHSVTNYSNPPGKQADSKAGTDATPGLTATAHQQDARHPNQGLKDRAANVGKPGKPAQQASKAAAADQPASSDKSQGPTASVQLDGASKGGAEATLQTEPSERALTPDQRAAFDVRGTGGSK